MILKTRSLAFRILLMVLFSGVVSGIDVQQYDSAAAPLLDRIALGEGTTDAAAQDHDLASAYDITYAYGEYNPDDSKPLSEMNIGEVKQLQQQMLANQAGNNLKSSAVGKYQIMKNTLVGLVENYGKQLGLSEGSTFNAETQDKLGLALLEERGYSAWIKGEMLDHDFQKNLAKEWASVADPDTGNSYYGQGVGTTDAQIKEAMAQTKRLNADHLNPANDNGNGASGDFGELAAEQAVSLVGLDIPYHQSTGPSQSKGWKNKKFLDANSPEIKRDGLDCSGVVVWSYNKAAEGTSITSKDTPIKTNDPTMYANAALIYRNDMVGGKLKSQTPKKSDLKPGDLLFLHNTISSKSGVDHVAMYVGNGHVVHASANTNTRNNVLATEAKGNKGKIIDGPKVADGHTWWKIEFEDGTKGWSSQDLLKVIASPSDALSSNIAVNQGIPSEKAFKKDSSIEVTSDNVNVRSTPTTKPTGVTELSLENWLKLPTGDSTYEKHLAGYGRVKGADIVLTAITAASTPNHLSAAKEDFGGVDFTSINLNYISVNTSPIDGTNLDYILKGQKALGEGSTIDVYNSALISMNAFITGLALPNYKLWVNLNPWEPSRIIDEQLGQTDVGRIMLEADLQMKKDFSSYGNPCANETGKKFWNLLKQKHQALVQECMKKFPGEIEDEINVSFMAVTRFWIVPKTVYAYNNGASIYIINSTLTIRSDPTPEHSSYVLDNPLISLTTDCRDELNKSAKEYSRYARELEDDMILPYVANDVNNAEKYRDLRSVYTSLALAQGYKDKIDSKVDIFRNHLDSSNVTSLKSESPWSPEEIWERYVYSYENKEYTCWQNNTIDTTFITQNNELARGTLTEAMLITSGGVDFGRIMDNLTFIEVMPQRVQANVDEAISKGYVDDGKDVLLGAKIPADLISDAIGSGYSPRSSDTPTFTTPKLYTPPAPPKLYTPITIPKLYTPLAPLKSYTPPTPLKLTAVAQESRPETGTFVKDTLRGGLGELTIINDNHKQDALAVITNLYKEPLIAVYIRSDESFKISGIVDGTYDLYFKLGNKWDGNSIKFTENGGQYRLDRSIDFKTTKTSYSVEYSIWSVALEEAVSDANMAAEKVPVSEEDFPM